MAEYRWFDHYDPGVPHTLEPYPTMTLLDVRKSRLFVNYLFTLHQSRMISIRWFASG